MTSIQDRVNVNRAELDKWTKRDQLCLASAVSCSGDQNWMTVSRSLKLLCGANHPPDWFSQKLCAVKYGELLENVETPKRKKRTTSDNAVAPSVVETPTDSILRRLTEERIQELKSEIRDQQETYAKLYTDVVHLQTGNSNEEQIRAMWMETEREQEQDRNARARKQMAANEMQRNWRQGQQFHNQIQQQQQLTPIKQEQDMDIDETCKPQATSPLLSSLLKSSSPAPAVVTTTTTSTVRVSAPTITNLLTGGIVSSTAASSSSSQTTSFQSAPFSKPLTGPAPGESVQISTPTILSPSQSAPTLSMLLEKTKSIPKDSVPQQLKVIAPSLIDEKETATVDSSPDVKNEEENVLDQDEPMEDGTLTPTKEEEQQLMEVFKNLIPDNIDELADILTNNHGILNTGILEEESILDGVESMMNEVQEADDQLETKPTDEVIEDSKNHQTDEIKEDIPEESTKIEDEKDAKKEVLQDRSDGITSIPSEDVKEEIPYTDESKSNENDIDDKIETILSDDSSDNVPLSTHTKDEKSHTPILTGVEDVKDDNLIAVVDTPTESPVVIDEEESQPEQEIVSLTTPEGQQDDEETIQKDHEEEESTIKIDLPHSVDNRKRSLSDSSDVIIIPTDDESNEGKTEVITKKRSVTPTVKVEDETDLKEEISKANEIEIETSEEPITSICLPDTDDESNTFETPSSTPKEEKLNYSKLPIQIKKPESHVENRSEDELKPALTTVRKLRDRDRSESPLVEDDASDNSATQRLRRRYSSTPVLDSVPNSPASGDDRELKVWKKSLMTVYNNLLTNKNATIFLRPITDEQNPLFKQVCRRPMDLQIIKRHIENGVIRNVTDFQRDVFLMCHNVIIAFQKNSSYAKMAKDLMQDFLQLKENIIDSKMEKMFSSSASSSNTTGVKVRGSSRKSQRLP